MTINYRPDIDGLRALAVIPVVLFHAGVAGFPGGYVGVDIFFVISGFLITSILLKDMESGDYSIANFYHRRIKRIFPALFVVLIVTTLVAMWLMFPYEFKQYQSSVLSTLLFYSNYLFMFDVGYFDGAAESKPLLHMWSLAVEEQFYVFFPVYLYLIFKYFRKWLLTLTWLLLIVSFTYSLYLVNEAPSDAFYSTPSRIWELLCGSVLAILNVRKLKTNYLMAEYLGALGFCLIMFSIFTFSSTTQFPGASASLPVIGSCLIIMAGFNNNTYIGRFLSLKPLVFVGLISFSFSLYLWHWPVLVFYEKFALGTENVYSTIYLMGLMTLLAYLSWRFIENPFRSGPLFSHDFKFKVGAKALLLMASIVLIVSFSVFKYKRNLPPVVSKVLIGSKAKNKSIKLTDCENYVSEDKTKIKTCYIGALEKQKPTYAVLGDSHGKMLLPAIIQASKKYNQKGVFAGSGGCLALLGVSQPRQGFESCDERADAFLSYLRSNPNITQVFLISRWAIYANSVRYKNTIGSDVFIQDELTEVHSREENLRVFDRAFERTMSALQQLNVDVVLVAQVPESEWSASDLAFAKLIHPELELNITLQDYEQRQLLVNKVFSNYSDQYKYQVIYPHEKMCDLKFCKTLDDGVSIYRDNNHITRTFALTLSDLFVDFFKSSVK